MNDKKSSRVQFAEAFEGYNRETWPEMIRWLGDHIEKLDAAFSKRLKTLNPRLKSGEAAS